MDKKSSASKKKSSEKDKKRVNQTQYEDKSDQGNKKWNSPIMTLLGVLILLSIYMQYQFALKSRSYAGEEHDELAKYYDILGLEEGASVSEIRKAYKDMAKIWHPDKNPGCETCAEKFKLIAKAGEVLINQSGDENKSSKTLFNSSPYFLTTQNYHRLVEQSNDFWVICVYESQQGNTFNKLIADAFDDVHNRYKSIIKFGVIDALKQPNLLHFLPYKFQFYPNIITLQHGESEIMENLDVFSTSTLISFIDHSFTNKVNLVDDYYMNKAAKPYLDLEKGKLALSGTTVNNLQNALDIKYFVLSGKNNIDIVTKDFASFYQNQVEVYQNDLGFYDKVS